MGNSGMVCYFCIFSELTTNEQVSSLLLYSLSWRLEKEKKISEAMKFYVLPSIFSDAFFPLQG